MCESCENKQQLSSVQHLTSLEHPNLHSSQSIAKEIQRGQFKASSLVVRSDNAGLSLQHRSSQFRRVARITERRIASANIARRNRPQDVFVEIFLCPGQQCHKIVGESLLSPDEKRGRILSAEVSLVQPCHIPIGSHSQAVGHERLEVVGLDNRIIFATGKSFCLHPVRPGGTIPGKRMSDECREDGVKSWLGVQYRPYLREIRMPLPNLPNLTPHCSMARGPHPVGTSLWNVKNDGSGESQGHFHLSPTMAGVHDGTEQSLPCAGHCWSTPHTQQIPSSRCFCDGDVESAWATIATGRVGNDAKTGGCCVKWVARDDRKWLVFRKANRCLAKRPPTMRARVAFNVPVVCSPST